MMEYLCFLVMLFSGVFGLFLLDTGADIGAEKIVSNMLRDNKAKLCILLGWYFILYAMIYANGTPPDLFNLN